MAILGSYWGVTSGTPSKTMLFLGAIATACVTLAFLPIESAAQRLMPYTPHTLSIDAEKGIFVNYPKGWSVAQPTMNTWVILNVPADQQESVAPTVRVQIG